MFDDPSVRQLLFHAGTKLAVLVGLIFVWYVWVTKGLVPYLRSLARRPKTSDGPPAPDPPQPPAPARSFPFASFIACSVLTIVFIYYATFEVGLRSVQKIDNPLVERRNQDLVEHDAHAQQAVVPPDGQESLRDKTQRRLDQADQDNDTGLEQFEALEPVDR